MAICQIEYTYLSTYIFLKKFSIVHLNIEVSKFFFFGLFFKILFFKNQLYSRINNTQFFVKSLLIFEIDSAQLP